ncbi:MAG TPA: hypothetical protein VGP27_13205, partial [Mycobacterium sp.]|nr:hypothetical protein [Mycobacterium sp.]
MTEERAELLPDGHRLTHPLHEPSRSDRPRHSQDHFEVSNWNTFQFCRRSRYADRVSASTQPAIDGWFATDGSGQAY